MRYVSRGSREPEVKRPVFRVRRLRSGCGGSKWNGARTASVQRLALVVGVAVFGGSMFAHGAAARSAQAAPENTAPPVVNGAAQEGNTLTLTEGQWTGDPAPTLTHQ